MRLSDSLFLRDPFSTERGCEQKHEVYGAESCTDETGVLF